MQSSSHGQTTNKKERSKTVAKKGIPLTDSENTPFTTKKRAHLDYDTPACESALNGRDVTIKSKKSDTTGEHESLEGHKLKTEATANLEEKITKPTDNGSGTIVEEAEEHTI